MKKNVLLVFCLVFFIGLNKVNAITNVFRSDLEIKDNQMDSSGYLYIDINIDVSYKLKGVSAEIFYDKSKLQLEEVLEKDKFYVSINNDYSNESSYFTGVYTKGKSDKFTIATLKFKKNDSFVGGDKTTIKISNIKGSDDTAGIENKVLAFIPGYMVVESILADKTDITDTKKYETESSEVNLSVNVICGKVISGEGKINLKYGNNRHTIIILGDDNKEYKINVELIRKSEKENGNYKNNSEKNINTGDSILKYVGMLLLSLSLLTIFLVYMKKMSLIKK